MDVDKQKDSYIRFRIDYDTKKKFQEITNKRAVNISELFRQWIEKYIEEHSK